MLLLSPDASVTRGACAVRALMDSSLIGGSPRFQIINRYSPGAPVILKVPSSFVIPRGRAVGTRCRAGSTGTSKDWEREPTLVLLVNPLRIKA